MRNNGDFLLSKFCPLNLKLESEGIVQACFLSGALLCPKPGASSRPDTLLFGTWERLMGCILVSDSDCLLTQPYKDDQPSCTLGHCGGKNTIIFPSHSKHRPEWIAKITVQLFPNKGNIYSGCSEALSNNCNWWLKPEQTSLKSGLPILRAKCDFS